MHTNIIKYFTNHNGLNSLLTHEITPPDKLLTIYILDTNPAFCNEIITTA